MKKRLLLISAAVIALGGAMAAVISENEHSVVEVDAIATPTTASKTIYLKPTSLWNGDSAEFGVEAASADWLSKTDLFMEQVTGHTDYWRATIPADTTYLIFLRLNPNATGDIWNRKWNQTNNINLAWAGDADNIFTITSSDNGYWCSYSEGYPGDDSAKGSYLRGGWNNGWTPEGQVSMAENPTGTFTANVSFGASGTMKMVQVNDQYGVDWIQASSVTIDGVTSNDFKDKDGNVVVTGAANYQVVVSNINNGSGQYVLTSAADPNLTAAISFATGFTSAMNENCPYTGTDKTAADVVSTWDAQSKIYSPLDNDVKAYFADGKSSTIDEIKAFASSYEYIYQHYPDVRDAKNGGNFVGYTINVAGASSVSFTEKSNVPTEAIVLATIGAIGATAGFFFLRKKKEQ